MNFKKIIISASINLGVIYLIYQYVALPGMEIGEPIIGANENKDLLLWTSILFTILGFAAIRKVRLLFSLLFLFFWIIVFGFYSACTSSTIPTEDYELVHLRNKTRKKDSIYISVFSRDFACQDLIVGPEFNITTNTILVRVDKGLFDTKILSKYAKLEAQESCNLNISKDPLSLGYNYALARCFNQAINYYLEALRKEPIKPFAYRELGNCFLAKQDYQKAKFCFNSYLSLLDFQFYNQPDKQPFNKEIKQAFIKEIMDENYENLNNLINGLGSKQNNETDSLYIYLSEYCDSKIK